MSFLWNIGVAQSNFDATTDPTSNDDISLGYSVGSLWVNVSTDEGFQCVDNTDGVAIWESITKTFRADFIDFKNSLPNPSYLEGRVFYDNDKNALSYYNDESDTTINIGQETVIKIHNNNGGTILNGQALRFDGNVIGGIPTVVRSLADTTSNARVAGIATHDITVGDTGYMTVIGQIGGLDTSSFDEGDVLSVSDTTPGLLVNIEQQIISIAAIVCISDATEGCIIVAPRDVEDPFALAQVNIASAPVTQAITTTPSPVAAYDNTALPEVNINTTFTAGSGQFEANFSPASPGLTGFYEFTFNARCTYNDSKNVEFILYVNGFATSISDIMPFSSLDPTEGAAVSFSGITSIQITNSIELEIYVNSTEASGTLTYESILFNVKRLGNV